MNKQLAMTLAMALVVTCGYTLLYAGYAYMSKTTPGRVWYVAAVVVGTFVGSALGNRWFN